MKEGREGRKREGQLRFRALSVRRREAKGSGGIATNLHSSLDNSSEELDLVLRDELGESDEETGLKG